jgi:hypothetical protein
MRQAGDHHEEDTHSASGLCGQGLSPDEKTVMVAAMSCRESKLQKPGKSGEIQA